MTRGFTVFALMALVVAGCGSASTATQPPPSHSLSSPATNASAAPARSAPATVVAANAKLIAYGLASGSDSSISSLRSSVAGAVMTHYIRSQELVSSALAVNIQVSLLQQYGCA